MLHCVEIFFGYISKINKYFVFCMPNSESVNNKVFLQKLELQLLIIYYNEDQRVYFQYKENIKKTLKI